MWFAEAKAPRESVREAAPPWNGEQKRRIPGPSKEENGGGIVELGNRGGARVSGRGGEGYWWQRKEIGFDWG